VGYAYVFKNPKGLRDKVCIYYPRAGCIETDAKIATEAVMNYPKRNEEFGFGNVLFYHEALQLKQHLDLKKLKETEDYIKENTVLHENITGLKRQIADLKQRTVELSSDHKKVKIEFDEEIFKTKIAKNMMEEKLREQEKELMSIQFMLDDATEQLNGYKAKAKRPEDVPQFLNKMLRLSARAWWCTLGGGSRQGKGFRDSTKRQVGLKVGIMGRVKMRLLLAKRTRMVSDTKYNC